MKKQTALVSAAVALLGVVVGVFWLSGEELPREEKASPPPEKGRKAATDAPPRTPIQDIPRAKRPPLDISQLGTHLLESRPSPAQVKEVVELSEVPYTGFPDPRAARVYEMYQGSANLIRKRYPDPETRPANQSYLLAVKEAELTLMNEQRLYYVGDSKFAPNMADLPPRTSDRYFIMTARGGLTIVFELHRARFPGAFLDPAATAKVRQIHEEAKKEAHMENRK